MAAGDQRFSPHERPGSSFLPMSCSSPRRTTTFMCSSSWPEPES